MTSLLSPREKIERLIHLYAELLDAGRLEDVSQLFERGCIKIDGRPEVIRGSAAVKKMFTAFTLFYNKKSEVIDIRNEAGSPYTRHMISNLYFESLSVTDARVHSCFTVTQCLPGERMDVIVSGRYLDTFACDAGAWYFIERYEYIDLIGDISRHLKTNPFQ